MAMPVNQHCANCIGTLLFPIWRCGHSLYRGSFGTTTSAEAPGTHY